MTLLWLSLMLYLIVPTFVFTHVVLVSSSLLSRRSCWQSSAIANSTVYFVKCIALPNVILFLHKNQRVSSPLSSGGSPNYLSLANCTWLWEWLIYSNVYSNSPGRTTASEIPVGPNYSASWVAKETWSVAVFEQSCKGREDVMLTNLLLSPQLFICCCCCLFVCLFVCLSRASRASAERTLTRAPCVPRNSVSRWDRVHRI